MIYMKTERLIQIKEVRFLHPVNMFGKLTSLVNIDEHYLDGYIDSGKIGSVITFIYNEKDTELIHVPLSNVLWIKSIVLETKESLINVPDNP